MALKIVRLSTNLGQKVVAFSVPKLRIFWGHARKELLPPSPAEFGLAIEQGGTAYQNLITLKFLNLTVKEATLNCLIGVEILCWFFVGEMIGRGSIIGYQIPELHKPAEKSE